MADAEDYERRADECRALATSIQDLAEREALMRIALQWETLARYKRKGRASPAHGTKNPA